jgi:hypothetical protein
MGLPKDNRKVRWYELTTAGRRQPAAEKAEQDRMASIIQARLRGQEQ